MYKYFGSQSVHGDYAILKKLPVMFVCENNLLSVCTPMSERQGENRDRLAVARAHGIWGKKGYGNDVEEVYVLASEAKKHLIENGEPVFFGI